MIIPNPIAISCTTCHQAMRVEFQDVNMFEDDLVVAVECACGRKIGTISHTALYGHVHNKRPLISADIGDSVIDTDIGKVAAEIIGHARERIARVERWIAAATWARGGR